LVFVEIASRESDGVGKFLGFFWVVNGFVKITIHRAILRIAGYLPVYICEITLQEFSLNSCVKVFLPTKK
jgi:hypothetical protein